jgi:A/G-specific adenine glycosylase
MHIRQVNPLRKQLMAWYRSHHRPLPWRNTHDPYPIWVSEVMLQQTQVKTVVPYFKRFLSAFPDVEHLAQAELQAVLKLWEGLGYYARARNLHRAAQRVMERFSGKIPASWEEFRQLPGVGDYVASAVLSIAFDQPYAVADGNVKRVLARLLEIDAPVNHSRGLRQFKGAADTLLDRRNPGAFNQALMELGAMVCRPNHPTCGSCPLKDLCGAFRHDGIHLYPRRTRPNPRPTYQIAVGVIYRKRRVLITQRPRDGLLGGLWEFPGGKIEDGEDPARACLREIKEEVNLDVAIDTHLLQVKHGYTHFKIVMEVFRCRYVSGKVKLKGSDNYRWVSLEELQKFPFPRANLKFMHLLEAV